ncbi:hypothetical protein [Tropicimonas sp. IMCC34011]|uniref:hypothetical protein n=1 Tax=Tropicimonas sp. IMCC34011 TaxID=2248759 RepID=UPI000E2201CB|nr:hypothetical protein [Tropicimonas sp. IMCC34011]
MVKQAIPIALMILLAACGGGDGSNPVNGDRVSDEDNGEGPGAEDPGPEDPGETPDLDENTIPDALAQNLRSIAYDPGDPADPGDDTLTVEMNALDADRILATYDRNAALDVAGYRAFSVQDDALDRIFVALAARSSDGSVQAVVAGDAGQFTDVYQGGYYERVGDYAKPTEGQVSYAGNYAGVTNLADADQDQRMPVPPGTDPALVPQQAAQTTGSVFINVDFGDNAVNGAIYDRRFVDGPFADQELETVFLADGDLDDSGVFLGTARMRDEDGVPFGAGTFGGTIGGENSEGLAGVVALDTIFIPEDPREEISGTFDRETGIFVLPRCGTADAPAICTDVDSLEDID